MRRAFGGYDAEHKIGHLGFGDFHCDHVRRLRDLWTSDAKKFAHERISRNGPAGVQMADVVGLPAWLGGKLSLRRVYRIGILPHP